MLVKCQFCSKKDEKDNMVKVEKVSDSGSKTNKYYHKECLSLLKDKKEAVDKFYEYTGYLDPIVTLYVAFKKMKAKGLDEHDILYTMNYIIETNGVLNYPMGLLYYLDRAMKDKKYKLQLAENRERILNSGSKIQPIIRNDYGKLNIEDSLDASDFIDEE